MRKFRFRFEALEKVRRQEQDRTLRLLGTAQRAYQNQLEHKEKLLGDLERSLKRREELTGENLVGAFFQTETLFISGTKQRILQTDQAIARAKRAVEKSLAGYLAARKQLRTVETLREKDYVEYKREAAKQEQKNLNDLYVMRARLGQGEWK